MKLTTDVLLGFSNTILKKNFDGSVETPECHLEWWDLCTSPHPKVAIAAPRGHAKTTAITFTYTLACLVFRAKQHIWIVSDTISQAIQFVGEIKKEVAENEKLRTLFKIVAFEKETEDTIIVNFSDGYQAKVTAKGSEQGIRGAKWNHKRPDLIIGDDLENDEIVLNKDRREKFKRWFYGALLPCLSSTGQIRIVGTILHEDSLLNNLMPGRWLSTTSETPLKLYSTKTNPIWRAIKYRAHNEELTEILWPEKNTAEYFLNIQRDFAERGLSDVYSQEFLNEPIDDKVAFFRKDEFQGLTAEEKKKNVSYYITADLAVTKEQRSDYSVFIVCGMDENRIIQIRNVIRKKLDPREIVDLILTLNTVYKPELFGIEDMQVTKAIGPFLKEEMNKTGNYVNLFPLKHGGKDKIQRARSIQGRMRAGGVKFDKSQEWYSVFEDELYKFPRGRHDDQVDAFAYVGLMLNNLVEAPTEKELMDEEWYEQIHNTGELDARNVWTGY